jgi:hypothetical protein
MRAKIVVFPHDALNQRPRGVSAKEEHAKLFPLAAFPDKALTV